MCVCLIQIYRVIMTSEAELEGGDAVMPVVRSHEMKHFEIFGVRLFRFSIYFSCGEVLDPEVVSWNSGGP